MSDEFVPCTVGPAKRQHVGMRADWRYGNSTLCGRQKALDQATVDWFGNRGGIRRLRGVVVAELPLCLRCAELKEKQRDCRV